MTHYIDVFVSNFFAWVIVISMFIIVIGAMMEVGKVIHKVNAKLNADSNASARTPSVEETLAAIEYAAARNIKQRRN